MPRSVGCHCNSCFGERLHVIRVHALDGGKLVWARECSACSTLTDLLFPEAPGLVCPKCSHIRLTQASTRHRNGVTVRVRRCAHCRHKVRTGERFESLSCR